jgi:hypothetical protein
MSMFGIHKLTLLSGANREEFEKFMSGEVIPTAAEVSGSVNRGGRSAIKSQHLLKAEGDSRDYLWIVKDSGAFDSGLFTGVFERMYEEAREKLQSFTTRESSIAFLVLDSFDAGPRGVTGRPTGEPIRGGDI